MRRGRQLSIGERDDQSGRSADSFPCVDPEDIAPPRPRISVAGTLALILFLGLLLWLAIFLAI